MSEVLAQPCIAQMDPGAFHREHRDAVVACLARVVDSGWFILGREVSAFEAEFASKLGFEHAVGVANGTDALVLALRALGFGAGDRIATVSHTAVATVAAIELAGAQPVLLDIDPTTYTMDPKSLERALDSITGIRAVIPVHLYGQPADLARICALAARHGLRVIEDCSQAHGARQAGRAVGVTTDAATFSFYPTKNLGALGDGGLVATQSAETALRVRRLREYGWKERYVSDVAGMNSRLDELQAAVLRLRLPLLDANNERRASIAAAYHRGLASSGLVLPHRVPGDTQVFHQYVLRHPDRDAFRDRLKLAGVLTNIHYPVPVHAQRAYAGRVACDPSPLSATETAAREVLSLPMYPELPDASVAAVIDSVRRLA